MSESLGAFFSSVPGRIDREKLRGVNATYRFDVEDAGSWHVTVADGEVTVAESDAAAQCVIRASEKTLTRIVRGEQNPAAALMLGKLQVQGDMALALKLKDIL